MQALLFKNHYFNFNPVVQKKVSNQASKMDPAMKTKLQNSFSSKSCHISILLINNYYNKTNLYNCTLVKPEIIKSRGFNYFSFAQNSVFDKRSLIFFDNIINAVLPKLKLPRLNKKQRIILGGNLFKIKYLAVHFRIC